jgi:hypothetical protein
MPSERARGASLRLPTAWLLRGRGLGAGEPAVVMKGALAMEQIGRVEEERFDGRTWSTCIEWTWEVP